MKANPTTLTVALIGCGFVAGAAYGQSMPDLKFSGFGTVAAVHSSERNADFVGSIFQPNGAGYTHATSFAPDSKLGGQVNAKFNDTFSGVVQLVSQHQHDNSWTPQVEWANLKYQATSDVSFRVGRIALPAYMLSESRFVGYANPWARPPQEVYGVLPITSNDGVDATYRSQLGAANNAVQAYYGSTKKKLPRGGSKSDPSWGLSDSLEFGSLTVHASYSSLKLYIDVPALAELFDGLSAFSAAPAPVGTQALALLDKYKLDGVKVSASALGATYDPGDWFVMGEFVAFKGAGFLSDSRSWYVSAGYRFGAFTPYASYADTKAQVNNEDGIASPNAAPLNAGLNATLTGLGATQHTVSAGVRWDFMKNLALKAQYDRITTGANSNGRFSNTQQGFVSGNSANVMTAALDFVF